MYRPYSHSSQIIDKKDIAMKENSGFRFTHCPFPGPARIGVGILLTCLVLAQASAQWVTKASMPTARAALAVGVANNVLYAVGGGNDCCGFNLTTVEAYDPAADMWTARASMQQPRDELRVGVINGIIYAVGGWHSPTQLGTLEAYDPLTNTWAMKAPMPTARTTMGVGVVNGILFAVGGYDRYGAGRLAAVEAYDPASGSWTTKAPLPSPRNNMGIGVINGILYAVGGDDNTGQLASMVAYDPLTDTWTPRASMPTARTALAVGVIDGVLYAVGGQNSTGNLATVEAYDVVTDAWSVQPSMLTARANLGAGVVAGILYAVGGGDGNAPLSTNEAFSPPPVSNGQFAQQGNKLVGTGGTPNGYAVGQGASAALSADGNTAIVGGYFDNSNLGAVWVFTRTNGVWSQQGNKLVGNDVVSNPSANPSQGFSVALAADGNTAIVGVPGDNGGTGAALVYTRTGGVWGQQGGKLVGTGAVGGAQQGGAVSISADGNTVIVGGGPDNGGMGAAWVFTRTNGMWTQQGSKLVGTGAAGAANQANVSLSADGNTAILGGSFDNGNMGAVWVFTRTAGVWSQQGSKLVGTGAVGAAYQGYSVSLSGDGNTAMVGGILDNNGLGATWIFTRTGGVWSQQGNKLVGTGAIGAASQGAAVSLSADGNTAIVGGPNDNNNLGAAWVFISTAATGSISGNVSVNGVPLAGVTITLLDENAHPILGLDPIETTSLGLYSFDSIPVGTYHVSIVDPLGYSVDGVQKSGTVSSGQTTAINFMLTPSVITNTARGVGYWDHQFDVAIRGRGHAQETSAQLDSSISTAQEHYTPHFPFFGGLTTFQGWDNILEAPEHAPKRNKALRNLAALVLNFSSLKVGQYTVVTRDGRTAGDALTYVSTIIGSPSATDAQLDLAEDIAEEVNEREMLQAGLVPAGNILYKGGHGASIIWSFDLPKEFALAQNYPNPFNPSTTISYALPADAHVTLKVYDVLGREVRTLVNDDSKAGTYEARFDAGGLASGVYLYRLEAGGFVQSRKLMVLK